MKLKLHILSIDLVLFAHCSVGLQPVHERTNLLNLLQAAKASSTLVSGRNVGPMAGLVPHNTSQFYDLLQALELRTDQAFYGERVASQCGCKYTGVVHQAEMPPFRPQYPCTFHIDAP